MSIANNALLKSLTDSQLLALQCFLNTGNLKQMKEKVADQIETNLVKKGYK